LFTKNYRITCNAEIKQNCFANFKERNHGTANIFQSFSTPERKHFDIAINGRVGRNASGNYEGGSGKSEGVEMGAWQMADLGNAANWEPMTGEEGSQHKQLKVASLLPWTPC